MLCSTQVSCPLCHAEPGNECLTPSNVAVAPHSARIKRAIQERDRRIKLRAKIIQDLMTRPYDEIMATALTDADFFYSAVFTQLKSTN